MFLRISIFLTGLVMLGASLLFRTQPFFETKLSRSEEIDSKISLLVSAATIFEIWDERLFVGYALDEMSADELTAGLIKRINQGRNRDNYWIPLAFGELGTPQAKRELTKLLEGEESLVKKFANQAILKLNTKETKEPKQKEVQPKGQETITQLKKKLDDKNHNTRYAAVDELVTICNKKEIEPELIEMLKSADEIDRGFAGVVLVELGLQNRLNKENTRDIRNLLRMYVYDTRLNYRAWKALKILGAPIWRFTTTKRYENGTIVIESEMKLADD